MDTDDGGLEILSAEECAALLDAAEVGRLAFVSGEDLVVLLVNHRVDRGAVLIRTAAGSKLEAAVRGRRVAFEVDDFDAYARTGWSVLVQGTVTEVWEGPELDLARRRTPMSWAPGERDHVLVVFPSATTGRRIHQTRADAGIAPLSGFW